jgi:acetoin:2,6-dichlorophenolindophenol oxidoreductase subunit alpha
MHVATRRATAPVLVLAAPSYPSLSRDERIKMLHDMWLIRAFEEKCEEIVAAGKLHGTMHLSIGQEGTAVGALTALRDDDYLFSTHRGHGHSIAKGTDVKSLMAEFLGKETGCCRGRGGSMHFVDIKNGHLGTQGIVAGGLPMATGVGLSIKLQRRSQVALVFFGDGATNNGAFHEAMNMASIWKLPVIFLCENNQYGYSTAVHNAAAVERLSTRATAYAMPGVTVDGNDVMAVYDAVRQAAERARQGMGPSLIEAVTYRWRGHSKNDANRYRTLDEIERWKQKCPIKRWETRLQADEVLTRPAMEQVRDDAYAVIESAYAYADASPEACSECLEDEVYA